MATHSLPQTELTAVRKGSWFARILTAMCAIAAVVLLGAGLYLMAMGGVAAAQSQWFSGEVQSRMIGPVFVALGMAFFFAALHRALRPVRATTFEARMRRMHSHKR